MIIFCTEFTAAAVVVNFELFIQPLVRGTGEGGNGTIPVNRIHKPQQHQLAGPRPGACDFDLFVSGGGARNRTLMRLVSYA